MAAKIIQTNTLQAGALGDVDRYRPMSPRYATGCEIAENCIPQGGVLTNAPGFGSLVPFMYRAQSLPPPDQKYYLRNQAATDQTTPEQATWANDTVVTTNLKTKLDNAMAAGTYWAKRSGDNGVGSYSDTVAMPFTGSNTPFWATTDSNTVENNDTIKYVRGFQFTNPATGRLEWGIVCEKTVSVTDIQWSPANTKKTPATQDLEPVLVLGRAPVEVSAASYSEKRVLEPNPNVRMIARADTILSWSELTATIKVTPKVYTAPKGWFRNSGTDVTIVGTMEMFAGAPNITKYTYTASVEPVDGQANTATVDTSKTLGNVAGMKDYLVLYYGAPAAGSTPDELVVGRDAGFTVTPGASSLSGGKRYYFQTTRTIVVGARRIGKAIYSDSADAVPATNTPDQRNLGLAATKIGQGSGNTPGTEATDPWFLSFDSPVQWYEPTYNGVVVGTSKAEYVLANEQSAPTSTTAGVSVRRISSIGTPLDLSDHVAISTQLNGNILFCTTRGVAQVTFSTERQQYLPQMIDLVAMGFGAPLSIASSKRLGIVFVYTDKAKIVCLHPDTGGITIMTGLTKTSGDVVYSLVGLDTVDGEPRIVWRGIVGNTPTYKMCVLEGLSNATMLVRTSRFGAYTGKNGLVQRAYVSLINANGGRVRVAASQNQTTEFKWLELPYLVGQVDPTGYVPSDAERAAGFTSATFTGVLLVEVSDTADNPSEGKAIELQFLPGECGTIVSVAVEMKEI